MRRKSGQSILEYVIVLTVVVAAIAVAANSFMKTAVQNTVEQSGNAITNAAGKIGTIGGN